LLGDTAVAVNPQDDRFKHLIGKTAIVPLCLREVPIIADDHVDMETGTGCLKVTPGHDFNDFEIGKRHNLKFINILNKDGTLNDYGMEFSGLSSSKARKKIVEKLEGLGLLVKTLPHKQQVGHGERTGAVIEPLISKQWFLNTKKMSQRAMSAVENDLTKFIPKSWENTYFSWLRDPRDWCISRQLIWGHQIPIYSCESCHHQWALEIKPQDCPQCHSKLFIQDPDVLDTWFSSGLWPLSTLGWPDKNRMESKKFSTFFPTTTLVTGFDIIFFWVVRMMMMSLDLTNQVPFKNVYIHAIVRDKLGRKMSKSLNNGIEPLEVIEQYGADALRFTLAAGSGYNRNINLDPARIEGFRNFINKIWNAFRFIYPHIQNGKNDQAFSSNLHHHEKWILTELNLVVKSVDHSIEEYRFDEACSALYSFIYDSFCGYFIELSKTVFYSDQVEGEKEQRAKVIKYVFREIVKLLHPICPFITEELWSHLKDPKENFLILQDFPTNKKEYDFLEDQKSMNIFIEVITKIRNLRFSVNLKPKDEIVVHLFSNDKILEKYFNENQKFFSDLARVKNIITGTRGVSQKPAKSIMAATSHTDIYIPLEGFIDIDDQIAKIKKELVVTELECQKFDKKINNPDFVAKAKPEAIDAAQQKHQELSEKIQSLKDGLKLFS
jgi:valyl-tRNA synthetase